MSSLRRSNSIFKPSVGKLLAVLMAAYFIYTFIVLQNKTEVSYYEVEEGSLVKEHLYKGLILRDETVYSSDMSGTVYYFVADGRKAALGSRIYCIDSAGNIAEYLRKTGADSSYTIDSAKLSELLGEISSYSDSFNTDNFSYLYTIDDSIRQSVFELNGLGVFGRSADEMLAAGIIFNTYYSDQTGTVCLYTDGYEDVDIDSITKELIAGEDYNRLSYSSGELIESGSDVYKLITDENWSIVFALSDEDRDFITDGSQYRISFSDKGFSAVAQIDLIRGADGASYGVIRMTSYLVQFTADRFVDFEIVTNNVSGLKVPDKSLTTKDFYVIPKDFLSYDEAGNSGFYLAKVGEDGNTYDFVITEIYNVDDEYCYIDCFDSSKISPGDYVAAEPGSDASLYQIGLTKPLLGAYNINKGYTVFRIADVLESSNGYSIVRKNTDYGLSPYDHIILDASTVGEGQLLYR